LKQEETNIRPRYAQSHIPNTVFYIPFGYYYAVRLGTIPKLLSWLLIYVMPTAFYAAIGYSGAPALFACNYLLILIATFSLYECGYIVNDTISIRHEEQPAIRLYDYNFVYFECHKALIFGTRIGYSLLALLAIYALNGCGTAPRIALSILIMALLFCIYNRWRSRYNVWLYPFLVCSRYVPFMLLSPHPWEVWLLLFLSFPLLNALERFSMPRYRWPLMKKLIPTEESKTLFRVAYYCLLSLIATSFFLLKGESLLWLTPIYILCAYRIVLTIYLRTHKPENYLNG
jgi:hypothetical protein